MPAIGIERAPAANGLVSVDGRTFPLLAAGIRALAEGGIARTTFRQTYTNPYTEPLEVLYTLPLPPDGSVIGYTIHFGEKIITGHIETREQARETYQKALESGRTAGLLEQERADTFTQSLGCLPPGADVRVEIEVLHPLTFLPSVEAADTASTAMPLWEYRFPTVVGVRYEGAPGRVPDAERLDVARADDGGCPVRLELELVLADGEPARIAPRSPSHELRGAPTLDGRGTHLALQAPAALDRDVVVQWLATQDHVALRLVTGTGLPGDDGRYGLLTLTPPARPEHSFARDLTLLIDASGSMSGDPLAWAKAVAAGLLRSLAPPDRFEVLAFSTRVQELTRGLETAAEPNLSRALGRLDQLQASGATEMANALERALRPLQADSQRQVVLLTDGYIGFESEVVGHALTGLPAGARLHAVGIGSAPNRTLTRGAARAGRGVELIVNSDGEADAAAARLVRATACPVLTDLAISGTAVRALAPEHPRDVFAGQPLVLALELSTQGGTVEMSGRLAGEKDDWRQQIEIGSQGTATAESSASESAVGGGRTALPLGALFGREAIADQEMRLAAAQSRSSRGQEDAPAAILTRIEKLGLRHRITSLRTSLVAVSEDPTVDPRDPRRRQRLAVELPAGVSAEGVGFGGVPVTGYRMVGLVPPSLMLGSSARIGRSDTLSGLEDEAIIGSPSAPPPAAARSLVLERIARLISALRRKPAAIGMPAAPVPGARCVRVERDLAVFEFESPRDGFRLPAAGDRVRVIRGHGSAVWVTVDPSLSTHIGPHARGLTLRLALRTAPGDAWPKDAVLMHWTAAGKVESIHFEVV